MARLKPKVYGDRLELAGQVAATPLSDQAPDWIRKAIADRARAAEAGAVAQHGKDESDEPTVH